MTSPVFPIQPFVRYVGEITICAGDINSLPRVTYDHRLFFIRENRVSFFVEDRELAMQPGDVLLLRAGTTYQIQPQTAVTLWVVNFDLFSDFAHPQPTISLPKVTPARFNPAKLAEDAAQSALFLPQAWELFPAAFALQHDLQTMMQEYAQAERLFESQTSALMTLCLNRLFRLRGQPSPYRGATAHRDILAYISEHFAEELTNRSIAERFHYHPNYVNQIVHALTGTSLHQYMLRLRLHRATELLLSGNLPIREIALQAGFADANYFTQYFRRQIGCSPSVFRGDLRQVPKD